MTRDADGVSRTTHQNAERSEDVDAAELGGARAVREAYDLPAELADPDAEAVLSSAIDEVVRGDVDAAAERLSDAFATVCERDAPEIAEVADGHTAACHRCEAADEAERALSNPQD